MNELSLPPPPTAPQVSKAFPFEMKLYASYHKMYHRQSHRFTCIKALVPGSCGKYEVLLPHVVHAYESIALDYAVWKIRE